MNNTYNILFIDGLNDYSSIKRINCINPFNYDFVIFANSFINKYSNINVEYIDNRDLKKWNKDKIYQFINKFCPNFIFISTNINNYKSVINLKLKEFTKSNIYIVTTDKNIELLFDISYKVFYYKKEEPLFYQFTKEEQFPFVSRENSIYIKLTDFIDNFYLSNKTATITTGYDGLHNFEISSFSNSKNFYTNINQIESDIYSFVRLNKKYIHINNLNIALSVAHIKELCDVFLKHRKEDLFWSIISLPKLIGKLDVREINLMKKSGLERVELLTDIFNGNNNDILDSISKLSSINISSISINVTIGSENDNPKDLSILKKIINKSFDIAPGIVEYNFQYDYPTYSTNNGEYINTLNSVSPTFEPFELKGSQKYYGLKKMMDELIKTNMLFVNKSISLMNASKRHFHLKLHEHGLTTHYTFFNLYKSSTSKLFAIKKSNKYVRFSWEINDEIGDYSPVIVSRYNIKNDIYYFSCDKMINTNENSMIILNEKTLEFVNITNNKLSLKQIFNSLYKKFKASKSEILDFYSLLEQNDLLYYTKIF
jgi:hypothetical protein